VLIRGQAPPDDFCNDLRRTGNQTGALGSSQGRRPRPSSFSERITHDLFGLIRTAVIRGEPRMRPFDPTPVPVPPGDPGLPDRDTESTASPRTGS